MLAQVCAQVRLITESLIPVKFSWAKTRKRGQKPRNNKKRNLILLSLIEAEIGLVIQRQTRTCNIPKKPFRTEWRKTVGLKCEEHVVGNGHVRQTLNRSTGIPAFIATVNVRLPCRTCQPIQYRAGFLNARPALPILPYRAHTSEYFLQTGPVLPQ